jgi:beta-lactamase superfamily II metal-dependent hydrolase
MSHRKRVLVLAVLCANLLLFGPSARAIDLEANAVLTRVVDNGQGLCTVTALPDGKIVVYDAGHWDHDDVCLEGVQDLVDEVDSLHGQGTVRSIEMMILSHSAPSGRR